MPTIKTRDNAEIYYKDWGKGPVVTFAHVGRSAPTRGTRKCFS